MQKFPTPLLRLQHALGVSLNRKNVKELVVAMERSKNQQILTQISTSFETRTRKEMTVGTIADKGGPKLNFR